MGRNEGKEGGKEGEDRAWLVLTSHRAGGRTGRGGRGAEREIR